MSDNVPETCLYCRWFALHRDDGKMGECRRRDPSNQPLSPWPVLEPDEWCGEWQSQEGARHD